jgi:hypothetical protein
MNGQTTKLDVNEDTSPKTSTVDGHWEFASVDTQSSTPPIIKQSLVGVERKVLLTDIHLGNICQSSTSRAMRVVILEVDWVSGGKTNKTGDA